MKVRGDEFDGNLSNGYMSTPTCPQKVLNGDPVVHRLWNKKGVAETITTFLV